MACIMYVDSHRHVIMEYKRGDKFVHTLSMMSGEVRAAKYTHSGFKNLNLLIHQDLTPERFVEVCLKSTLPKTPRALAVLAAIQSNSSDIEENSEPNRVSHRPRNYNSQYTLRDIIEGTSWNEGKVRKYLRKRGQKPGTRWEWSQEEAEEVMSFLLTLDDAVLT